MTLDELREPIERVDALYFAVTKPCPEALVKLGHAYNRLADKVEAAWERERDLARLVEELGGALDRGERFERAYQESLGTTWTRPQQERLDSLQSAFLDSYVAALESLAGDS